MTSAATARQPHQESKTTKRFEFGYERKSAEGRSVQTARADFLSIVLATRPNAVFSLFMSAYQPFSDLLANNASRIASIYQSVDSEIAEAGYVLRQPKFIGERAIKMFMPGWHSLQQIKGADPLWEALGSWAGSHNLTDEWCLDHALAFLRAWDEEDDSKMAIALLPDVHFLIGVVKRCWQSAVVDQHLYGLWNQFQSNTEVEERGVFSFTFKHEGLEFRVSGPFTKSVAAFKREVEQEFEAHDGQKIRGARKALQHQLSVYLKQVKTVVAQLGLEAFETRWATTDHLTWLIHYQLPPCKSFRQVARDVRRNEKTVRDGIRSVAQLIGITLRSAEGDKHLGRPRGARDRTPRLRVDRGRQKLRGNET